MPVAQKIAGPRSSAILAPAYQPLALVQPIDGCILFLCVPVSICPGGVAGGGSQLLRVHSRCADCWPVATAGNVCQPLTRGGRNCTDTRNEFSGCREFPPFHLGTNPPSWKLGFWSTDRTSARLFVGATPCSRRKTHSEVISRTKRLTKRPASSERSW